MTRSLLLRSLTFAVVLFLSLRSDSFWTDEAFSAYLASHGSIGSLVHTLWTGDSSDLQMPGYYLYLFLWAQVLPVSELSLRAANTPFLLLFSVSLVYGSFFAFRSRHAWLVVACLPFVWHYAGEARAYMAILAFSTAAFGSLLSFSEATHPNWLRILPWLCLGSILIGSVFHMLCLLSAPPLVAMFCILALKDKPRKKQWRYWLQPALVLSVPFTLLLLYFAYTFARGTHYAYPAPGWRQMLSVVYELAGFSGLGPNLKLSIQFGPYTGLLVTGAILFCSGMACAIAAARAGSGNACRKALTVGSAVAVLQLAVLAGVVNQQFDARHCAALIPALLFLYISSISHHQQHQIPFAAITSGVLLGGMWMMSDFRLLFLNEYRKEDYKTAVQIAMNFARQQHGSIALFADPLAGAYYGLDPQGAAPCFPLLPDCSAGLQPTHWDRPVPAAFARTWSPARLQSWIQDNRMNGLPVALIFELDRSNRNLPWWPALGNPLLSNNLRAHGFDVATIGQNSTP